MYSCHPRSKRVAQALLEVGERDAGARPGHRIATLIVALVDPEAKGSDDRGQVIASSASAHGRSVDLSRACTFLEIEALRKMSVPALPVHVARTFCTEAARKLQRGRVTDGRGSTISARASRRRRQLDTTGSPRVSAAAPPRRMGPRGGGATLFLLIFFFLRLC